MRVADAHPPSPIPAGHALSLQYHEQKDEVIFLLKGKMPFQAGPSTNHLDDVVRLEDWFGRV